MISLDELLAYLDFLLEPEKFKDYCPNGLQIEGKQSINTIVTGVTANQALINAAIALNADTILVHHGFFWKNEIANLTGIKFKRIKSLILHDISLLAYHLPLDAHPLYGNNIQLGELLELESIQSFEVEPGLQLGFKGLLKLPLTGKDFADYIEAKLSRMPLYIEADRNINVIGWCSGAAQDYIQAAIDQGVDAYLTGEVSERTFHIAKEHNIHFYAAGHHATERYGVKALGEHLSHRFNLQHHFVDIVNPV